MPKALDVPWDQIRSEFCQGVSANALAAKFNVKSDTISVRASRQKWKALQPNQTAFLKRQTQKIVEQQVAKALPVINEAIREWTDKSHDVAKNIVSTVSKKVTETATPDALLKLASALEKADGVGRKALGMDTEAKATNINLSFGLQVLGSTPDIIDIKPE